MFWLLKLPSWCAKYSLFTKFKFWNVLNPKQRFFGLYFDKPLCCTKSLNQYLNIIAYPESRMKYRDFDITVKLQGKNWSALLIGCSCCHAHIKKKLLQHYWQHNIFLIYCCNITVHMTWLNSVWSFTKATISFRQRSCQKLWQQDYCLDESWKWGQRPLIIAEMWTGLALEMSSHC